MTEKSSNTYSKPTVFVVLDGLFTTLADGRAGSNNTPYQFYQRYLSVFGHVVVAARQFATIGDHALPVEGEGVSFRPTAGYQGPVGFLMQLRSIVPFMVSLCRSKGVFILRLPATLPIIFGLCLLVSRRRFGVELIGEPKDAYSSESLRNPLSFFFQWLFVTSTRALCRNAVSTAYVTACTLQKSYPNAQSREYSYTSLDLPDTAVVATGRPASALHTKPLRLLQVAAMQNYYKGQDITLQTLKLLIAKGSDVCLTFVGDGPLRGEIQQQAKYLGIASHVNFKGKLSSGVAIWNEMDNADILINPSRQEGLPRVVIEAMARGLPCVASNVGGTNELLDGAQLVKSMDPTDYADNITQLMNDNVLWGGCSLTNVGKASSYVRSVVERARRDYYNSLL